MRTSGVGWSAVADRSHLRPARDYPIGNRSLRKTIGAIASPDDVGRVDAVLLSHAGAQQRLDGAVRAPPNWQHVELPRGDRAALRVTGVPARHGPPGCEPTTGPVTGFVLTAGPLRPGRCRDPIHRGCPDRPARRRVPDLDPCPGRPGRRRPRRPPRRALALRRLGALQRGPRHSRRRIHHRWPVRSLAHPRTWPAHDDLIDPGSRGFRLCGSRLRLVR